MCARHLSWWLSSLFSMLKPSTLSSSLTWLLRVLREGACVQEEEARRNGNRCECVRLDSKLGYASILPILTHHCSLVRSVPTRV